MKEYTNRTKNLSRTLETHSKAVKQLPISEVLQYNKRKLENKTGITENTVLQKNNRYHTDKIPSIEKKNVQLTPEDDFITHFKSTAKVGLELTFFNDDTQKYVTNKGFSTQHDEEAKAWWNKLIEDWMEMIRPFNGMKLEIDPEAGHNKDLGNGIGAMRNPKIKYKNDEDNVIFWYQLSMDPGVVEIQTSPVTGDEIQDDHSSIINEIYMIADGLKLTAGKGGGHINVDFESGLNSDYSLIPKILFAMEAIKDTLESVPKIDESEGYSEEEDTTDYKYRRLVDWDHQHEDPFISTERVKMKVDRGQNWCSGTGDSPDASSAKDYKSDWESKVYKTKRVRNEKTLRAFKDAHATWLFIHPTYIQYAKKDSELTGNLDERSRETILHYQAINIDHLFDEVSEDSDPRRLEFRFFRSQENIDEIIRCIELVAKIVYAATKIS